MQLQGERLSYLPRDLDAHKMFVIAKLPSKWRSTLANKKKYVCKRRKTNQNYPQAVFKQTGVLSNEFSKSRETITLTDFRFSI